MQQSTCENRKTNEKYEITKLHLFWLLLKRVFLTIVIHNFASEYMFE